MAKERRCLVCKGCGAGVAEESELLRRAPNGIVAAEERVYVYELDEGLLASEPVQTYLVDAPASASSNPSTSVHRLDLVLAQKHVFVSACGPSCAIGEPFRGCESHPVGCKKCSSPVGFAFHAPHTDHPPFAGLVVTRLRICSLSPDALAASRRGSPSAKYDCVNLLDELLHSRFGVGIRQLCQSLRESMLTLDIGTDEADAPASSETDE
jgi:hypothetical protein